MNPLEKLVKKANDILSETNETFEDWRDALSLYETAGGLGSGDAYAHIADMYISGKYMKINYEKSIAYCKKSIHLESYISFVTLSICYYKLDELDSLKKMPQLIKSHEKNFLDGEIYLEELTFITHLCLMKNIELPIYMLNEISKVGSQYLFRMIKSRDSTTEERGIFLERLGKMEKALGYAVKKESTRLAGEYGEEVTSEYGK
jgi:hypothetical protein